MMPGKLPVPGRSTIWMIVGQGPTKLKVRCGWDFLWKFNSPQSFLLSFSFSLGYGSRPSRSPLHTALVLLPLSWKRLSSFYLSWIRLSSFSLSLRYGSRPSPSLMDTALVLLPLPWIRLDIDRNTVSKGR